MRILGPAREQVCGPEHVRSTPDRLGSLGSDTYARTKGPVRILGPAREQVCGPEHVRRSIPDRLVSLGSDTYARTKGPVREIWVPQGTRMRQKVRQKCTKRARRTHNGTSVRPGTREGHFTL